ncbi:hypothetical protein I79_026090 [Cricetulus griseus]|uniref:Uncharacterized protein n=1 Tax=Cricetulus griseus TaxID=10029 RepID=G3IQ05_CRIGR|nr:hypothetical protein I79_026090 [Cricetulus griseus]
MGTSRGGWGGRVVRDVFSCWLYYVSLIFIFHILQRFFILLFTCKEQGTIISHCHML